MKKMLPVSLILNILFIAMALFALHRYGGWRNLLAKINSRGIEKTYLHRKNLFEMLPPKEGAIIFLGNSITAQNEWAEMLGNAKVLNRGIAGDHCDGIQARLEGILKHHPSKIFLMIGINDLGYHPPVVVLEKYRQLVEAILTKSPGTVLYLQSVLPINKKLTKLPVENSDIAALNEGIKKMAIAKELTFIDLYPLLLDPAGNLDAVYTDDGVHLNGRAYLKWVEVIQPFTR